MKKQLTVTFDAETFDRLDRMADHEGLSKSALIRFVIDKSLGIEDTTPDNAPHNAFSLKEVEFIFKRYEDLGPTALATECERLFGKKRRPGTITNRYQKSVEEKEFAS